MTPVPCRGLLRASRHGQVGYSADVPAHSTLYSVTRSEEGSGHAIPCMPAVARARRSVEMDLLWLGEPACHDRALVGGKAAHLSRLAAGQRVPPGFCLTAAALEAALAGALARDEASAMVPALPPA